MKSRYDVVQDPQQRRRLALALASPAAALAVLLLAGALLLGCSEAPVTRAQVQAEKTSTASVLAPYHIVASEGDIDYREPLKYMGQPAVQ